MAEFVNYVCLVFTLLLTILGNEISAGSTERTEQHPARDFTRHTLTKPRIYHGREKRQISTTKEEDYHIDHLTVNLPVDGEEFVLDLTLNKQLIPKGFFRKVQENGKHEVTKPSRTEIDLCHYNGKVRGRPGSWVALSTCHGLSGVIYDGEEMHYVERDPEAEGVEAQHLVFRHSDLAEHNKTCGFPDSPVDPLKAQSHNRMHRYKRAAKQDNLVRGPYNANKESKYVELVLVVDNQEYKELGESTSKVEYHCKTIANIINGLYAPLNIFIALVGVVIWTDHDEISFSPNGDTTLTNFLHYRREKLVKEHPNDNAQLLTKFTFENGVVGKALKGPICTYEYSGGVNTDHSSVVGLVATTVAHEMGHNFGMEHDTNECTCPDDRCIMAPSSSTTAPTHWSSCSINYLLLAFTHGMDYCLKNKPESLFGSPVCGNGFVEPGEQCDCGLPEHCDNTCCNATTCMLYGNASCATGECCDLTTCKPKNAGTLCRSADYECDLPEYCTGQSEYCPSDIYKRDTEVCDDGNSFCYHGFCRTRTDQCKLLWGETGKSSDEQCYKMNVKGNRHGNCGYNKLNQSFFKCTDENVLCGMLHCKHLNERLEFGMESVSILSHSFLNLKGSIVACRTAMVDLGINQVDPGLSPDGAKCGEGKMCVNQRCMSVESLKTTNILCPHNCNNNGWCNNLGHCHCKDGFAPPYCEDPGPGGSEDSGPASDPNAGSGFVTAMFIIFLAVIPSILVCLFAYYYMKHNGLRMPRMKKPPPPPSKSPSKSRSALPAKRNEANHSLLQEDPSIGNGLANEFFGQFKGFTLTPKKTEAEPIRAAPPPPIAPPIKTNFINRSVSRAQSFKQNITGAISSINNASTAPALPPPNPGSTAKPIISSPILENSTCTAKELISPLKNAPSRPAPQAPALKERPVSTHEVQVAPLATSEDSSIKKKDSTLNRIASFLTKKQSNANLAPSAQVKASKIDKDALKSIEISGPILQKEIEIKAVPVENKPVMRAQSMRTSATTRPNIPNFGSMRQTGAKRPMSIPAASRPKSPPPPVPLGEKIKLPSLPGYQKPTTKANQYDDCLNKKINDDNIYAVIEESPTSLSPQSDKSEEKSKTSDNMGLLSEIVSEIQNRNFDSIYSTSTLARKKKEAEEKAKMDDTYVNASVYKSPPESVYSNMNNASASSTSSGYIHPSSVNAPVKTEPKQEPHKPMSTFKSDKPYVSPFTRPAGPFASTFKSNQEKTKSPPSPVKTINRQVTPPNLRTRKSSPVRPAPVKPKQVPNSPDLVTSCNSKPASKGPDVLNVKKPAISSAKPILNGLPKAVKPPVKSVSFKTPEKKAPPSKTAGIKNVTRSNSNVASLQQKFENKANVPKPVVKSKT